MNWEKYTKQFLILIMNWDEYRNYPTAECPIVSRAAFRMQPASGNQQIWRMDNILIITNYDHINHRYLLNGQFSNDYKLWPIILFITSLLVFPLPPQPLYSVHLSRSPLSTATTRTMSSFLWLHLSNRVFLRYASQPSYSHNLYVFYSHKYTPIDDSMGV